MVIEIKNISDELKIQMQDLITRPVGKYMYNSVEKILRDIAYGEVVVLNFNSIRVIDPSFIDEFIVKLIIDSRDKQKVSFIKLSDISDTAEMNIDSVFNSYYSYKKIKIVVVTDRLMNNNSFFIGQLSEIEKDIIDYMSINKIADVEEIADFLGGDFKGASQILDDLYSLRVIRKEINDNNVSYLSV